MKKIIAGRRYDTETARLVGSYNNGLGYRDFEYIEEELYQKKTGEYFLYGSGGPLSSYAVYEGNNTSGSETIKPLTEEQAKSWAEINLDADDYEAEFSVIEDDEPGLALKIGRLIAEIREAKGISQAELARSINANIGSVGRMERGENSPSINRVVEVCMALDIKMSDFFKRIDM